MAAPPPPTSLLWASETSSPHSQSSLLLCSSSSIQHLIDSRCIINFFPTFLNSVCRQFLGAPTSDWWSDNVFCNLPIHQIFLKKQRKQSKTCSSFSSYRRSGDGIYFGALKAKKKNQLESHFTSLSVCLCRNRHITQKEDDTVNLQNLQSDITLILLTVKQTIHFSCSACLLGGECQNENNDTITFMAVHLLPNKHRWSFLKMYLE